MRARLRSRWQKMKDSVTSYQTMTALVIVWYVMVVEEIKPLMKPLVIIAIIALSVGLVLFVHIGYGLTWTGFSTKTLWDWMQILLVPLMLAIGGFWFSQVQKSRDERAAAQRDKTEREATAQRDKTEREIAADNQHEAALQAYLDKMSELLLKEKLRDSAEEDEIRKIARVWTLAVLRG
jgi:ABC-type nickel/cobalt efflux system permease component RcnA